MLTETERQNLMQFSSKITHSFVDQDVYNKFLLQPSFDICKKIVLSMSTSACMDLSVLIIVVNLQNVFRPKNEVYDQLSNFEMFGNFFSKET